MALFVRPEFYFILIISLVTFGLFLTFVHENRKNDSTNNDIPRERREADLVKNLPGQPPVSFRQYAGYVNLDEDKAYFYWFYEEVASEKPLLLWLNFGPSCSSIAYGAVQEVGPFLVQKNESQLLLNNNSWIKAANLLFVEAPIGVGFSYTNKSEDLSTIGDQVTAEDTFLFLIKWFERFSTFKSHDFYMAGESYAGHYAPQLAEIIDAHNKRASQSSYINLKGFMLGNPALDESIDKPGYIEYAWTHSIISDELYERIRKLCDFQRIDQSISCSRALNLITDAYGLINIFDIYASVCASKFQKKSIRKRNLLNKLLSEYDPCTNEYAMRYLNRPDVQKALHANVTNISYPYATCSLVIKRWDRAPRSVLPLFSKLIKAGLRIWVYSGDTDGRLPVSSTALCVRKMGLNITKEWRAWFHNHEVAGRVVEYEGGLTFATIRGAGHFVPLVAREVSLSLVRHFLANVSLPSSRF